jgi:hypothetical protein
MNPNMIFEDFDRKYQGSFVSVSIKNEEPHVYQLRRMITDSSKFPKLELLSDKLGSIILNYNTNATIMFKVPRATFIQCNDEVMYFTRIPERQWKRGVHQNNCRVVNPLSEYGFRRHGKHVDFDTVREALKPTYFSLADALNLLNTKGYTGVALSRNVAILNPSKKGYVLFYRLKPIGTVSKDGIIDAPNFTSEIQNEIK